MQAIRVHSHGGPESLALDEVATPEPGPGQVLIQVTAAGVNFVEIYQRKGVYAMSLPAILGGEGAGTVVALGDGVTEVGVGDRVGSTEIRGSYAQYALADARRVVPLPDSVSDEVGAAVLLQGMTAHYLLHDSYPVRAGDTVLVHAAAGGVGLLLTQMAHRLGARVIATTSTAEKAELARLAGADELLSYEDVPDKVRELTGGTGVAAVYDGVGTATFDASLASLRLRGSMVLYGQSSGPVPPFDLQRLNSGGSLFVSRPTLAHFITTQEELRRRAGDLFGWIGDGSLHVDISHRYPLAEAARAHEDLAARRTTGKVLLIP